ncbi:hypothetical protein GCM10022226_80450 [Sphaerisporangium flaviroseum]|uniref:Group II intron reverse transcriptase/maturase n=1 Tax=Sphaerisporangium flaviroseum TaxID=509199 RepID=A0ABP7JHH1_9ACTN
MNELKAPGKSFEISKRAVQTAGENVKANKGASGVDGMSIEEFEKDLRGNLCKIWNRMSSGTYFRPPVQAVEIPKAPLDEAERGFELGHVQAGQLREGRPQTLTAPASRRRASAVAGCGSIRRR